MADHAHNTESDERADDGEGNSKLDQHADIRRIQSGHDEEIWAIGKEGSAHHLRETITVYNDSGTSPVGASEAVQEPDVF